MTQGEWRSTRALVKSGYLEKFDIEYRPTDLGKALVESCLALMRGWPEERKKTKRRAKPATDLTGAEEHGEQVDAKGGA
jgi:DNA-binding HxlR family transcriptional regulator